MGKYSLRSRSSRRRRRRRKSGGRSRSSKSSSKLGAFSKVSLCFGIFCVALVSGLYIIDTHIANLEYIHPLMQSFDPDLKVWKENIRSGNFGDLGKHDRRWQESRNLGYAKHQDSLGDLLDEAIEHFHIVIIICIGAGLLMMLVLLSVR